MFENLHMNPEACAAWNNFWTDTSDVFEHLQKFVQIGMTEENIKAMSFREASTFLRSDLVVEVSKGFFEALHKSIAIKHRSLNNSSEAGSSGMIYNVRIILASYMLTFFPEDCIQNMGELETIVVGSSAAYLENLKAISDALLNSETKSLHSVPESLTKDYPALLTTYHKSFMAWKLPRPMLVSIRIKHALVALIEAKKEFSPDEPADSELSLDFETQMNRLCVRFGEINGPDELIRLKEEMGITGN